MKVFVAGLFHLGCVTAACLAKTGHEVIAYDPDKTITEGLKKGSAPIFEPGLDALLTTHSLKYTSDPIDAKQAEIVWVTFDTPVDDHDIADVNFVINETKNLFQYLSNEALVIISSQLPVGSTRQLQQYCAKQYPDKKMTFACSPENLRLGKAIQVFTQPDRIVVGLQDEKDKEKIQQLLGAYTSHFIWISIESAEMTKHALNAFLATSVVFINELATLCERVGANAREVELGLKSEERIGPKAYLRAGNAIAGGTLARDVNYLTQIGQQNHVETPLFSAILNSNQLHKQWSCNKIMEIFKNLSHKKIALLGLTYKAGTNTLRRSTAIEMGLWLNKQGAEVVAHDPALTQLPDHLTPFIHFKPTAEEALKNSDAVVIATEWPQFSSLNADTIMAHVKQALVFDPGGFLMKLLSTDKRIRYFSVGSQA